MKTCKPKSLYRFFRSPLLLLQMGLLFVLASLAVVQAKTIDCPGIAVPGTTDISTNAVDRYTNVAITDLSTVAAYTFIKIHSRAEAQGLCYGQAEVEGACVLTGMIYERTVNHTSVYVDIVSTGLNGHYFVGNVYGMNPNGTGHDWHVLDTHNSDNTGPNYSMLAYPGSYDYTITAYINTTPCEIDPDQTDVKHIVLYVSSDDEEEAALVQAPHRLPEHFVRVRNGGLFGDGWRWLLKKQTVV